MSTGGGCSGHRGPRGQSWAVKKLHRRTGNTQADKQPPPAGHNALGAKTFHGHCIVSSTLQFHEVSGQWTERDTEAWREEGAA